MATNENLVIVLSAVATVAGLGMVGIVDSTFGFPSEWSVVVGFVLFVGIGYVFPQLYLLRVDNSTDRVSRLGVITLMLLIFATALSDAVTGPELAAIWAIVGVTVVAIFAYEIREGYRESQQL